MSCPARVGSRTSWRWTLDSNLLYQGCLWYEAPSILPMWMLLWQSVPSGSYQYYCALFCPYLLKASTYQCKGGNAYPFRLFQFLWKVSVSIAPGSGLQLMYLGSWCFKQLANRSTLQGPKELRTLRNSSLCSFHSADICTSLDSWSAIRLLIPGRWDADRVIIGCAFCILHMPLLLFHSPGISQFTESTKLIMWQLCHSSARHQSQSARATFIKAREQVSSIQLA